MKTEMNYKGELKDFPHEVVEKMLEHQVAQGNQMNVEIFEKSPASNKNDGGFNWYETPEGTDWSDIIGRKDFNVFFNRYPKKDETTKSEPFNMLSKFPDEIVELMLERQEEHGNKRDVEVFEKDLFADFDKGGFNWHETPEGFNFWYGVIAQKKFDLFKIRYPRKKMTQKEIEEELGYLIEIVE